MSTVDEVKQKLDIVEVIGHYVTLKKSGRNFTALCPFHQERTPSFFVFPERQSWHCFGACGTGGDVFSFIMKQEGLDFSEALRFLARQAGVTVPSRIEHDTRKDEKERLYQVNEAAARFFHEQLLNSRAAARAREYLQKRGFTAGTVTTFRLGYSPDSYEVLKNHLREVGYSDKELIEAGLLVETDDGRKRDRFRNRLIFPINDARGRTTGFGARVLDDSFPKYTNSPQTLIFDKSGTLYAIDLAASAIRKQDQVIIVEGYMDAITAHQNGLNNIVASMGTSITLSTDDEDANKSRDAAPTGTYKPQSKTDEDAEDIRGKQFNTIRRLTKNVILALDADSAGEEAMLRCVDYENILDAEIKIALLPKGKDPDDFIRETPEKWHDMINNAIPVVDYTINKKTDSLDISTARDQSRIIHDIAPVIAKMKDSVRRDHYIRRLETITKTRYNIIEGVIREYMAPSKKTRIKREPTTTAQSLLSRPLEEYCLRLLLRHPELMNRSEGLLPEYFQDSQNREIFLTWKQVADLTLLKERLDPALWDNVESLASFDVIDRQLEDKFFKVILRLREQYLRDQKEQRAVAFAAVAEEQGAGADLARLQEEEIKTNSQLQEVFEQKARRDRSTKRWI